MPTHCATNTAVYYERASLQDSIEVCVSVMETVLRKWWNKEIPLAILSRIYLAQTCLRNPSLHNSGKGLRLIVLDSIAKGISLFHDISHGVSYPYIPFIE